ncbi:MAG: hypothetical protein NC115_10940, partial [Bacteroidales bacterium]|nr:hypothetical protein [Bacteroidales bacterium]
RMYDPFAARWTTVDPMAAKHFPYSSYVFCSDDPVNRLDPDGEFDWRVVGKGALATVSGVGAVASGVGLTATAAGAPFGMALMVEGFTSAGLGLTLMITGAVSEPSEKTDQLLENLPTSATGAVAKSLDVVAGNENGEIEKVTSTVMVAISLKGGLDILTKDGLISLIDKLSLAGATSDVGGYILDFIVEDEEENDDEQN